ncbi:MAG: dipeptidase PepE, partial [Pseudonocardia sp.]|nr:dipeptidase PepE [Pseudonocardia sp.]
VLFIPYALADHDAYVAEVTHALAAFDIDVTGAPSPTDPVAALRHAEVLFIGGGNTFRLLRALQSLGLIEPIRAAVRAGTRYIGASAGTNVACPSLRTTNDMPIVQPRSFEALSLLPFQINPHYLDPDPHSTHMGETREQRLLEYLEENEPPVLSLREGSWLRVSGNHATIGGPHPARLFERHHEPKELPAGADVSYLLTRSSP